MGPNLLNSPLFVCYTINVGQGTIDFSACPKIHFPLELMKTQSSLGLRKSIVNMMVSFISEKEPPPRPPVYATVGNYPHTGPL